jgi:hypothetical protein
MISVTHEQAMQIAMQHHRAGRWAEAEALYRQILSRDAANAELLQLLGVLCAESGRAEEAVELLRRAVAINPSSAEYRKNLAAAYRRLGNLEEAIAQGRKAIELQPDFASGYNNLGGALSDAGQWAEAEATLRRAIELRPDYAEAHYNRALQLLRSGDFQRGWAEFEWRTQCKAAEGQRRFNQPSWNGRATEGQTILIYCEQGFGDAIQFIRYVPMLSRLGMKVIVESPLALLRLFQNSLPSQQVIVTGQSLPPFDVQYSLMSLPLALGTTLRTIPAQEAYLTAPPDLAAKWEKRFDPQRQSLRVGLAWAGRIMPDRNRSIPFEQLSPLLAEQSVDYYSLQKSAAAPAGARITDWTAELEDFADTAALIAQLDLVITVDTAVAHLAGALGKAVWVLLPFSADWRWMVDRQDSPWYPTMRLFRQPKAGDWQSPVAQMAAALRSWPMPDLP